MNTPLNCQKIDLEDLDEFAMKIPTYVFCCFPPVIFPQKLMAWTMQYISWLDIKEQIPKEIGKGMVDMNRLREHMICNDGHEMCLV